MTMIRKLTSEERATLDQAQILLEEIGQDLDDALMERSEDEAHIAQQAVAAAADTIMWLLEE